MIAVTKNQNVGFLDRLFDVLTFAVALQVYQFVNTTYYYV